VPSVLQTHQRAAEGDYGAFKVIDFFKLRLVSPKAKSLPAGGWDPSV